MTQRASLLFFLFFLTAALFGDDLEIRPGQVYIELSPNATGFDLYVQALPGRGSILITESSADPEKKADSYAFRAWDYNPVNGDEKRILNGEFLPPEQKLYFLIDSTPEENELLGLAYRIHVPFQLTYGYSWSREGQVEVHQGVWMNIRSFEKPHADYRGAWRDNPFTLSMKELPPPPPAEILTEEDGPVNSIEEAVERIISIIGQSGEFADIVLVIDTTVSMKDDMEFIRNSLVPLVKTRVKNLKEFRVGMVLYRDYKEAYLTRSIPFTNSFDELQRQLNLITVSGGRDLQEAVNEGLYAALTEFEWNAPDRLIIQLGDAPAHNPPRGAISTAMVDDQAARNGIAIHPIRLPNDQSTN